MRARPADESAVPDLLDMMEDFNRLEQIPWTRSDADAPLRTLLRDPALGLVGLLELDGASAGYFVLAFSFDLEWCGRDAFLTELYLRPERRGRGLGRRALAEAEALARAHEVRALHLAVRPDNAAALRLYRGAGFVDPGRVMLSKPLNDMPLGPCPRDQLTS